MNEWQIGAKKSELAFTPTGQRVFQAREVEVSGESLCLHVPGRGESIDGNNLLSKNIQNANPIEVVLEGDVLSDGQNLWMPEGRLRLSSEKNFDVEDKFLSQKGELRPAIMDPDMTEIDGRTLYQTGTLTVQVKNALITLKK